MPLNPHNLAEAIAWRRWSRFFCCARATAVDPSGARGESETQFRSKQPGRVQAMLFVIYPIGFVPAGLAYLARWAFDAHADGFFGVLAFDAVVGMVIYGSRWIRRWRRRRIARSR